MKGSVLMAPTSATVPTTLDLLLLAHQTEYVLDLGGKSPAEFRQLVLDLESKIQAGKPVFIESFPAPPAVDLQVEILNRSDREVELWLGGDDSALTLELTGPGALNVANAGPFTANVVPSERVVLAPGASHLHVLPQLFHGFRGYGRSVTGPSQVNIPCWLAGSWERLRRTPTMLPGTQMGLDC